VALTLRDWWTRVRDRLGWIERAPDGSLVVWVGRDAASGFAATLASRVAHQVPRLPVFAVGMAGAELRIGGPLRSLPLPAFGARRRSFLRMRPPQLLTTPEARGALGSLLGEAARRGIAVGLIEMSGSHSASDAAPPADLHIVVDAPGTHWTLRATHTGETVRADDGCDALVPHVVAELQRTRQARLRRGAAAAGTSIREARSLPWLRRHPEWRSIDAIRQALADPACILCLGNGPTSARPDVLDQAHDRLFRVNASWLERGHLVEPDVVFTSLESTLRTIRPRAGFVLKDADTVRSVFAHPHPGRRIRFGVAERLGLFDAAQCGELTLTNGAIMIALAVALAPRRLVIAGVDLFADPAGAYPGDTATANDYTAGHSRTLDRDFICDVLSRYRGDLDVRSPVLASALAQHRQGRPTKT
jgi:hypothetical protein